MANFTDTIFDEDADYRWLQLVDVPAVLSSGIFDSESAEYISIKRDEAAVLTSVIFEVEEPTQLTLRRPDDSLSNADVLPPLLSISPSGGVLQPEDVITIEASDEHILAIVTIFTGDCIIYDGEDFSPGYSTSTETRTTNGVRFEVRCVGGWLEGPIPIESAVIDSGGNLQRVSAQFEGVFVPEQVPYVKSVFGRGGPHVVAKAGDFTTSLIRNDSSVAGSSAADAQSTLAAEILTRVGVGADLGGTAATPKVVKLQGRSIQDINPANGDVLTWSATNGRWEPKAPPPPVPGKTLPLLYSPVAQWPLTQATSGNNLLDRSGNNRHLTQHTAGTPSPDLVPGYFCHSGGHLTRADEALRITGAMTITLRAWASRVGQSFFSCLSSGESPESNELCALGNGSGPLGAFWETGAGTNVTWTSAITMPLGVWKFLAFRRSSGGVVTLNLDDLSESSPALTLPTKGAAASNAQTFCVSGDIIGSANEWQGGLAGMTVWDFRLDDAQIATMRSAMMGL